MKGVLKSIPLVLLVLFCSSAYAADKAPVKDDVTALLDTMKLLKESDAKLAMVVNKDLSISLINLNTGERIEGCSLDRWGNVISDQSTGPKCYAAKYDPYDNSANSASIQILQGASARTTQGAVCVQVKFHHYIYELCDPPYDLGFN